MARPVPRPRKEDEVMNFINNSEDRSYNNDNKATLDKKAKTVSKVKQEKEHKRNVVKRSLTLDKEVDKGLRYIMANEEKQHSQVIEDLLRSKLIKMGFDEKYNLKL